jgi:hypothetical protein
MRRERRPEDQLTDAFLRVCGAEPGVLVIDLRHVGKFAKVLPAGYGPPVQIGRRGQPDFLVLVDGLALGLEFKTKTGVVSDDQTRCHEAWASQGTPVVVVRDAIAAFMAIQERRRA